MSANHTGRTGRGTRWRAIVSRHAAVRTLLSLTREVMPMREYDVVRMLPDRDPEEFVPGPLDQPSEADDADVDDFEDEEEEDEEDVDD